MLVMDGSRLISSVNSDNLHAKFAWYKSKQQTDLAWTVFDCARNPTDCRITLLILKIKELLK